ncbi:MAG TPA: hypothetical protein VEJ46_11875 [Candidatus Acidoferrum sp.]|nr:hypothetical protein [Candidatus Acidoferrum sp.]
MNWTEIVKTLGSVLIGSGAGVWLLKSIWSQVLSRDLETFKSNLESRNAIEIERLRDELKRVAFEHETRYARLHEKRAEVLEELFKRLVKANRAFSDRFRTGRFAGEPSLEVQSEQAAEAANQFVDWFSENMLFIDDALREKIYSVNNHFLNLWRTQAPMSGEERGRIISEFFKESPALLDDIRGRILEMLSPSANDGGPQRDHGGLPRGRG